MFPNLSNNWHDAQSPVSTGMTSTQLSMGSPFSGFVKVRISARHFVTNILLWNVSADDTADLAMHAYIFETDRYIMSMDT